MTIDYSKLTLEAYKSILNEQHKQFKDWLGSCSRYLSKKKRKDIKYHG